MVNATDAVSFVLEHTDQNPPLDWVLEMFGECDNMEGVDTLLDYFSDKLRERVLAANARKKKAEFVEYCADVVAETQKVEHPQGHGVHLGDVTCSECCEDLSMLANISPTELRKWSGRHV